MLALTRRCMETILIGADITIQVIYIKPDKVRLAIEAPRDVRILRGELANIETDPGSRMESV